MTTNDIEEQRNSIPFSRRITSDSPDGMAIVIDIFIDKSKLDDFVKIAMPVVHKSREMKECIFMEICVNPQDKGHVRVMHGWTKSSDWWSKNIESSPWFRDYYKALVPMIDKSRSRVIEHFDLLTTK